MQSNPSEPLDAVANMAALLGRAGHDILVTAATLAVIVAGSLAQAAAVRDLGDPLATVRLALLGAMLSTLARSVSLLIAAHRRLLNPLSRLRRVTGASPAAPWPYLAPPPRPPVAELLKQVRALVADAHDRRFHAHGALLWAVASAGAFIAWTLANLLSGAGAGSGA